MKIDDKMNVSFSYNYNYPSLFNKFPKNDDKEWIKWVKSNGTSQYKYQIQSKPYPYSDDNMLVNIDGTLGLDTTPKQKQAPKRPAPLPDTSTLRNQQAKRRKLYYP